MERNLYRQQHKKPTKKKGFLQKLVTFLFVGGILSFFIAYFLGITPSNYKEFFRDPMHHLKDKFSNISEGKDTELVKSTLYPLPDNPFAEIDAYARNCPDEMEVDVKTLSNYLGQIAHTDIEKARVIFVWMTDNIIYNDDGYNSGDYGDGSAKGVLQNKKAVCDGFANLFYSLGIEMGLDIKKVSGYAKGYGYTVGDEFKETDHSWNIIKIDDEWRVFDATWGQGSGANVNGLLVSTPKFKEYWFNVDPYESIFNHYPEKTEYLNVSPAINLKQYENLPRISSSYFEFGFDGKETLQKLLENGSLQFPDCYKPDTYARVISAPAYKNLTIGKSYHFEIYMPRAYAVTVINADTDFAAFEGNNGTFKIDYIPTVKGELKISAKYEDKGANYWALIAYEVEDELN